MVSTKMQDALNRQINAELYSSYLYLSMAAWMESENLSGCAQWMRVQSREEHSHAMKLFDYLVACDARVVLDAIDEPPLKWKSALDVFSATLTHEKKVTAAIAALMSAAVAEKDYATQGLLQWFVNEQVEEEASALRIVDVLKMIGDSAQGLIMLDRELAQRK